MSCPISGLAAVQVNAKARRAQLRRSPSVIRKEVEEEILQWGQKNTTLEFASISDRKEAVAKVANLLFLKYLKLAKSGEKQEAESYTEARLDDAPRAVGLFATTQMFRTLKRLVS